jgi:hypothetical protein
MLIEQVRTRPHLASAAAYNTMMQMRFNSMQLMPTMSFSCLKPIKSMPISLTHPNLEAGVQSGCHQGQLWEDGPGVNEEVFYAKAEMYALTLRVGVPAVPRCGPEPGKITGLAHG